MLAVKLISYSYISGIISFFDSISLRYKYAISQCLLQVTKNGTIPGTEKEAVCKCENTLLILNMQ